MIPDAVAATYIDNVTLRTSGGSWAALIHADIVETDTLATLDEVVTAGYGRKSIPWDAPSGTPIVSKNTAGLVYNFTADVTRPIIGVAVVSAASGTVGTIRRTYLLSGAYTPKAGDSLTIDANFLKQGVK